MKKWLSLLLTVAMLVSCLTVFPAMAATTNASNPGGEAPSAEEPAVVLPAADGVAFTCDIGLSVDEQMVTQLLSSAGLGDDLGAKIVAIINNIGVKTVVAGTDAQSQLLLKGGPVMTMLVKTGEDGISIGSDLFPNSVLSIPAEMIQQMTNQVANGLEGLDMDAIAAAVMPHIQEFAATIQSKIGEPTATDFSYEGVQFTSMIPINITAKELATAVLTMFKGILSEEAVAPLLSQLNVQVSGLDEALEDIANSKDEEIPALETGLYSNENGDALLRAVMTKDEQSMTLHAGMLGNKLILRADALSQMKLDLTVDMVAMTLDLALEANNGGMNVGISFSGRLTENGLAGSLAISMNGASVATISVNFTLGGEVTATLDPEGKKVISLMTLQSNPEGEEAQALLSDIQTNGLSALLANAIQQMPEEVSALLTSMTGATAP